MMQSAIASMPEGFGIWGVIAVTMISGLLNGITINAVFAFGEEIAWRGFLMKELKGRCSHGRPVDRDHLGASGMRSIILNGHNYPQHPVAGVFMMVAFACCSPPMLMYFQAKSGSVIVPAIMHGTFSRGRGHQPRGGCHAGKRPSLRRCRPGRFHRPADDGCLSVSV